MIHYCIDKTIPAARSIEQSIRQMMAIGSFPQTHHLIIQFSHTQYYFPQTPSLELLALVSVGMSCSESILIEGSIFLFTPERLSQLQLLSNNSDDNGNVLREYCRRHSLPWLVMSDPWILAPIHIPKPWGQEIWYTGIEARGLSGVMGDSGSIPLPWLLEIMPEGMGLPKQSPPLLLKVLDPLPDKVYGDLYFELHQEKQEVYVVTHIDSSAWPEGIGAIQLGFAPQARQRFSNDDEFKLAYLNSVKAYEQVRRLVDIKLDEKKAAAGIDAKQDAAHVQLMQWMSELSQDVESKKLIEHESELRQTMNSFVASHPLTLGDVVTVPRLVPHALQHGVRVVEFQTPVYERKILSFGQKVRTQLHWDTEDALELAELNFAQLQSPELISLTPQLRIERIVNFDDFAVQRIQLDGAYAFLGDVYSVLMVLQGRLTLHSSGRTCDLESTQAVLLSRAGSGWELSSSSPCLFLLASPQQLLK